MGEEGVRGVGGGGGGRKHEYPKNKRGGGKRNTYTHKSKSGDRSGGIHWPKFTLLLTPKPETGETETFTHKLKSGVHTGGIHWPPFTSLLLQARVFRDGENMFGGQFPVHVEAG